MTEMKFLTSACQPGIISYCATKVACLGSCLHSIITLLFMYIQCNLCNVIECNSKDILWVLYVYLLHKEYILDLLSHI